ncbi:MAG: amidohydrolase family protein [Candidatus Caldatribacteriaceae bacterium]
MFSPEAEDLTIFNRELQDFLPERIFDAHVHLWKRNVLPPSFRNDLPSLPVVVEEFTHQELQAFYALAFPGREVQFLIFGMPYPGVDLEENNHYVSACLDASRFFGLALVSPETSVTYLEKLFQEKAFVGYKPYWTFVTHKEQNEVQILDMLTEEQLHYANRRGLCVVLHIPRKLRLADPLNVEQLLYLLHNYPRIQILLAHLGRSYCLWSIERFLDKLLAAKNLFFDITVVQNWEALEFLFRRVEPERVIFGSDLPISAVRGQMVCVNDQSLFITQEAYPWSVSNPSLGYRFTYMLYESIRAVKKACQRVGWSYREVEQIFYGNASRVIDKVFRKGGESNAGKTKS